MTRLTSLLTVAIAAAAIAVGCGDDDEGPESGAAVATSSLSQEQYAEKADELCQRERQQQLSRRATAYAKRNPPDPDEPPEVAYAETIRKALLPYLREELEKLRALGAPEGDEETVEEMLTAQQEAIDEVAELDTLSEKEGALESHFSEANELMRDYGIEECTAR